MVPKCFYAETADVFPGVVARSKAVHEYEKFIQATIYPHIIHPHSTFRVYWEIAVMVFTLCEFLGYFLFWAFMYHDSFLYQFVLNILLAVHLSDLVLMFFTGYVEGGTEIVVLDFRRITRRYLLRTFFLDLLASLPVELFTYFFYRESIQIRGWDIAKPCHFIIFSSGAQIFLRFGSALRYLRNTSKLMFWNPFIFSLVAVVSSFLFIININFCYGIFLNYKHNQPLSRPELWQDFHNFITFFLENLILFIYEGGEYKECCLFRIATLILGFFFTVYLTAYLIKFTRYKMKTKERFYTLENKVRIFGRKSRLPKSIRQKTLLYFKVFVKSRHYKEDEMFTYFPETFKFDMFSHHCLPLLKGFYAFADLPMYVLRRLTESLKYQLYLPNEIVMMKGEKRLSLYFIESGSVSLYTTNNTELYHFEDGGCFNGKHFMEGKLPLHHYAVSLEVTEIYKLDYEDFMEIMEVYPKLFEEIKEKFYDDIVAEHNLTL